MLYTTFTVKDKEYKCRLDAKSCVQLEKKLGKNPLNVFMNVNDVPSMDAVITILQASLAPLNANMTMDKVYELYDEFVDDGNTFMDLMPILMEIFKVSGFFKEEDNEEENSKN